MNKTTAYKLASASVGMPVGRGTSWHVYGPYYSNKLNGPSTDYHSDSYWKALQHRSIWVARIALVQMGFDPEVAESATYDKQGPAKEIFESALQEVYSVQ